MQRDVAEAVDRLPAPLQREQGHQRRVRARHHLDRRGVRGDRQVHPAVLARQREAHQAGLAQLLKRCLHRLRVDDAAVFEPGADPVDLCSTRRDRVGGQFPDHLEHQPDRFDALFDALRGELVGVREVPLQRRQDHGPGRVFDAATEVGIRVVEVGHTAILFLVCPPTMNGVVPILGICPSSRS